MENPKTALVHDVLSFRGGAERTLEAISEMFPEAPIFTLLYNQREYQHSEIARHQVVTSFIQNLPFSLTKYRNYLPLMPVAVEKFDVTHYQLLISSSYAVAHGVLTQPEQLHVSYIYTPMRHAWQLQNDLLMGMRLQRKILLPLSLLILHYFRQWDSTAINRSDFIIAPSKWVARWIWRCYRRESVVIYPPVDIQPLLRSEGRKSYYLTISRLRPYKKVDVIIDAFNKLGFPLIIVGEGTEKRKLAAMAKGNIKFLDWQSDRGIRDLMSGAKALIHMAIEDFGIALVEAQGSGCPVIAFRNGGASEIVIPGKTGLLVQEQTSDSLVESVLEFEKVRHRFREEELWENAKRFDRERFKFQFISFIAQAWWEFHKEVNVFNLGGRRGTIPQPSDPQSDALPIELRPPR